MSELQTKPYAMLKDTTSSLTGNDRFEGFCVDLIQELSKMLGFNYTFTVQKDGNNGNFDRRTQTWDGMIGEVMRGVSDAKSSTEMGKLRANVNKFIVYIKFYCLCWCKQFKQCRQ